MYYNSISLSGGDHLQPGYLHTTSWPHSLASFSSSFLSPPCEPVVRAPLNLAMGVSEAQQPFGWRPFNSTPQWQPAIQTVQQVPTVSVADSEGLEDSQHNYSPKTQRLRAENCEIERENDDLKDHVEILLERVQQWKRKAEAAKVREESAVRELNEGRTRVFYEVASLYRQSVSMDHAKNMVMREKDELVAKLKGTEKELKLVAQDATQNKLFLMVKVKRAEAQANLLSMEVRDLEKEMEGLKNQLEQKCAEVDKMRDQIRRLKKGTGDESQGKVKGESRPVKRKLEEEKEEVDFVEKQERYTTIMSGFKGAVGKSEERRIAKEEDKPEVPTGKMNIKPKDDEVGDDNDDEDIIIDEDEPYWMRY